MTDTDTTTNTADTADTAPVVVNPIPASQSRTLWTARWATVGTIAAAILPTIAAIILDMIGNPVIASIIANKVPVEYRAGIAIVFTLIIQRFGHLRRVTVAPIAGTPAAENAQQLISPSHEATARTKEN